MAERKWLQCVLLRGVDPPNTFLHHFAAESAATDSSILHPNYDTPVENPNSSPILKARSTVVASTRAGATGAVENRNTYIGECYGSTSGESPRECLRELPIGSPRLPRWDSSSHFLFPGRVSKWGAIVDTSCPAATMVLRILFRYASTVARQEWQCVPRVWKLTRALQEKRSTVKRSCLTPAHAIAKFVESNLLVPSQLRHARNGQLGLGSIHESHWHYRLASCGQSARRSFGLVVFVVPARKCTRRPA